MKEKKLTKRSIRFKRMRLDCGIDFTPAPKKIRNT